MVIDQSLSIPHMGYAIGRPIGGAVVRNRLRRRLRAIISHREQDLSPGWYLIGVSPATRNYDYAQLESSVSRLIQAIRTQIAQKPLQ